MKKLTMLMLLLTSTSAFAAWSELPVTNATGTTVFVDLGKIRNKGMPQVKMQHLINFHQQETNASGHTYKSSKALVEYDCEEEHYRVLAESQYSSAMGKGKVVSFTNDARQWEPVELDTIEETLWETACAKERITRHD